MASITSSEFVEWKVYLDQLGNRHTPLHSYLAQIAYEVRRSVSGRGFKLEIKHFLLKFITRSSVTTNQEVAKTQAANSKRAWLGLFGRNPEE